MVMFMKKIFVTGISQESNSFNPLLSCYGDFQILRGREFRENHGIKALIKHDFEVAESIFAKAVPGGILQFDDFLKLAGEMLDPLEVYVSSGKVDGVLLLLHGALEVEHIGSGETFILSKVREMVGPDVPISAALDMHANITYTFASICNIITGFRTAPHIDLPETHERAANLLARAIICDELPRTVLIRIPIMMPGEKMMTTSGLGKEIISRLPVIDEIKNVYSVSYFVGMTWVDCPQNGAAVVVSGIDDFSVGVKKAHDIADFVWSNRNNFTYQGLTVEPEEAMQFVKKNMDSKGLITVSDSADNVTAGAAGDNALLLKMFLGGNIKKVLFAAIIDPRAVEKCKKQSIGSVFDISIGAVYDKNSEVCDMNSAVLKHVTTGVGPDEYDSCVLAYRGIDVLLFSKRKPVFDRKTLARHGLCLDDYRVLVVKQGYLSPELNAATLYSCLALTPGHCSQDITRIKYKKIRRPMFPLDK